MAKTHKCVKCGYHPNSATEPPIKVCISSVYGFMYICPKCGHEWGYRLFKEDLS